MHNKSSDFINYEPNKGAISFIMNIAGLPGPSGNNLSLKIFAKKLVIINRRMSFIIKCKTFN